MSAEGKKKRGISGVSNAANIAFRYGGSRCDYSLAQRSVNHPDGAGSKLVQAMRLGLIINALGLGNYDPSNRLVNMASSAMDRCTSEHLT